MNVSQKIQYCRTLRNLTQDEVGNLLHVSRKTISGWETGRSSPDILSLVKLCNLFDISLDDLLCDEHMIDRDYHG
ncbi:helix-turn-helix domain-containing protein [Lentilactobacillus buchneri]|uniref:helix-turn-helix domain-containing protein n=1 Tax=Lentilactobacillus buchneri TaxID=1581 RepID=UPI0005CA6048|nr:MULTISPECIES: helix-turn-helix transcriptional regulator [Lentilactobacillus]MCT2900774.1 XRE family transcriptional regulator [Lentilactobacillus buchneri]MCT3541390.1 XRE family transcriptional regulator [Lentilactobacillus buchneri]MCT3546041.1 XRE family transcriptional regulator [Lentilactobacillus buchneri]MCT3551608.1 XRE family transcriptional regulator [Lentilactobacillus buchneri]MCV3742177.1 helix-turn-helix domain-containing protein [Lentilactobacillus hilgardii]